MAAPNPQNTLNCFNAMVESAIVTYVPDVWKFTLIVKLPDGKQVKYTYEISANIDMLHTDVMWGCIGFRGEQPPIYTDITKSLQVFIPQHNADDVNEILAALVGDKLESITLTSSKVEQGCDEFVVDAAYLKNMVITTTANTQYTFSFCVYNYYKNEDKNEDIIITCKFAVYEGDKIIDNMTKSDTF